jgi:hypothetical protein
MAMVALAQAHERECPYSGGWQDALSLSHTVKQKSEAFILQVPTRRRRNTCKQNYDPRWHACVGPI